MMEGNRIWAESNRMYPLETVLDSSIRGPKTDIGVLATKDTTSSAVMVWSYHDVDSQGPAEAVSVTLNNIPVKSATLNIYLIDDENSNSYEVWKKMGSPQKPSEQQISTLEKAGQLKRVINKKIQTSEGTAVVPLQLKRQAVALIKLDW